MMYRKLSLTVLALEMLLSIEALCLDVSPYHYEQRDGNQSTASSTDVEAEEDAALKALVQKLFFEGVQYFQMNRPEIAVKKFKKAYDLLPSWKLLYNIGQCEASIANYSGAIEAFEKYLRIGGDKVDVTRQDEILSELDRLKRMVGKVMLDGPSGYLVFVDGKEVGTTPIASGIVLSIGMAHHLKIFDPDTAELVAELDVSVLGEEILHVEFRPTKTGNSKKGALASSHLEQHPSATGSTASLASDNHLSRHKLSPAVFLTSISISVVAGVVSGILISSVESDWESVESNYQLDPWENYEAEKKSIHARQVASYFTSAVAVTGLAVAMITLPFTRWKKFARKDADASISIFNEPHCFGMVLLRSF